MIANKVENADEGQALFNKLNAVVQRYLKLPMTYLGAVPEDSMLNRAVMQQTPVSIQSPGAKSSLAYEAIAGKLVNAEVENAVKKRGMAAFFSHIIVGKKNKDQATK